ncbi:MAG TPA: helix-turn-helix domain-containing protein [Caldilineae bacterium]|nr:helix-turn-helix domain-containing protein [Caldilineae bacterium]
MPEWISVQEAAEISGYHIEYVRRLIRRGKLQAERKGPMYWIDRASLEAYLEEVERLGTQRFNWRRLRKQPEKQDQ